MTLSGISGKYNIKPQPDKRFNRYVFLMSDTEVPHKEITTSPSLFLVTFEIFYKTAFL